MEALGARLFGETGGLGGGSAVVGAGGMGASGGEGTDGLEQAGGTSGAESGLGIRHSAVFFLVWRCF